MTTTTKAKLTDEQLLLKLCYRDPRYPDYEPPDPECEPNPPQPGEDCYCDNCFHGRHELVVELLQHRMFIRGLGLTLRNREAEFSAAS